MITFEFVLFHCEHFQTFMLCHLLYFFGFSGCIFPQNIFLKHIVALCCSQGIVEL